MALYTLTLRTNLEHFLESIIYILYIVSKLGKSGVQHLKRFANRSWNEEVMAIWRQLHQAGGSFRNDFEIQLMISKFNFWIRNPLRNDTNFEFTHCHFDVLPPLPRELHLFNLWIRNPLRNDTNFEFTHCHFDVPPPLPRELHLKHSIRPRWTPHD